MTVSFSDPSDLDIGALVEVIIPVKMDVQVDTLVESTIKALSTIKPWDLVRNS